MNLTSISAFFLPVNCSMNYSNAWRNSYKYSCLHHCFDLNWVCNLLLSFIITECYLERARDEADAINTIQTCTFYIIRPGWLKTIGNTMVEILERRFGAMANLHCWFAPCFGTENVPMKQKSCYFYFICDTFFIRLTSIYTGG